MSVKIALAGNPNSGKTTLFNILTGSNQYVGNWPGVTVELHHRDSLTHFCLTKCVHRISPFHKIR